jgi:hypothetical protein
VYCLKLKRKALESCEISRTVYSVRNRNVPEYLTLHQQLFSVLKFLKSVEIFFFFFELKCQLDTKDDFYCISYCLLNMFRAPLCPLSGARENYTGGCCLYNILELLMMGIVVPGICWASNKICNKNHLFHLVGILFPHINDDARSKSHQICCCFGGGGKVDNFLTGRIF